MIFWRKLLFLHFSVQILLGCGLDGELNESLSSNAVPRMTSSNSINDGYAKGGDSIYLDFQASPDAGTPAILIAGYSATVSDLSPGMMRAEVSVMGSEPNGNATYSISYPNSNDAINTIQGSVIIKNSAAAPEAISLGPSIDDVDSVETPSLRIEGLEAGATVRLYSDQCMTQVGTSMVVNSEMNVIADVIPRGRHEFYAQQIDLIGNVSDCSVVFQKYRKVGTPFLGTHIEATPNGTASIYPFGGPNFDVVVDWGDGSVSEITQASPIGERTHTYVAAGTFQVEIKGEADGLTFHPGISNFDMQSVEELGDLDWKSFTSMFWQSNVGSVKGGVTSGVTSMTWMFFDASNAIPETGTWDTSNVTTMDNMFSNAVSASPNVSNWDTSMVTNMAGLFESTLGNPDVRNWDVSKVTDTFEMFRGPGTNPDVSLWNTESLERAGRMFEFNSTANPNVSGWDTSSLEDTDSMFRNATSAQPDMSLWDLSQITDMDNMFEGTTQSTTSYSNLLIALEAQNSNSGVLLDGGGSEYNVGGAAARTSLVNDHSWVFTDGGPE